MKIAFFGDLIDDTYIDVVSVKVNPENGSPVYVLGQSQSFPGGVGCAARTLHHFGIECRVFCGNLSQPTIKNRFVHNRRQIGPRFDVEYPIAIPDDVIADDLIKWEPDAVVVSDYRAFITPPGLAKITEHCCRRSIPCVIDSKRVIDVSYEGCVFKCNENEADALGMRDDEGLRRFSIRHLCEVVVTRGPSVPLTTFGQVGPVRMPNKPFQPSGAGDWFAAFLAYYLLTSDRSEAVEHAYRSAAATGYFPPFREPIFPYEISCLEDPAAIKILPSLPMLTEWIRHRVKGTICVTNGCFDILHSGHVQFLDEAKRQAEQLLVLVNCDWSVRKIKGEGRPIVPLGERMRCLASLASVDAVACFIQDTPVEVLEHCRRALGRPIDVFAKGGDTGQSPGEEFALQSWRSKIYGGHTSDLIRKIVAGS